MKNVITMTLVTLLAACNNASPTSEVPTTSTPPAVTAAPTASVSTTQSTTPCPATTPATTPTTNSTTQSTNVTDPCLVAVPAGTGQK